MKISILLPYKENFSPDYAGAVSIFINSVSKLSKFKKTITVYGNTNYKNIFPINYKNIPLKKKFLVSQSNDYVKKFINLESKDPSDIIEVHNRPLYINFLKFQKTKLILYFHNDPITMNGSKSTSERLGLLNLCSKIIFNSEWSKKRFLKNLSKFYEKSSKLVVVHQSIDKTKVNLNQKEKLITFVGKLNTAKGYDLFAKAIRRILNKHKNWKSLVIGDEAREKIKVEHKNLKIKGFLEHNKVLNIYKKTSIAVVCSRWEEPFGRTSLEAASRGCAVIISNRGGLPETITNGVIIRNLSANSVYLAIDNLILKETFRKSLQKLSINNFYLTNKSASNKIDKYRSEILSIINIFSNRVNKKSLKILHVTNFNERHNGRLFYNTGRRINNGFIRLNHSVLEFSDRDIVSYYRKINDFKGAKKLNSKLIEVISNYVPDLIVLGHADLIDDQTLRMIKETYPHIKIAQWFLDRMDSEWKNNKIRFEDKIELVDASFCTTEPKLLNLSNKRNIFFIPNPVDVSLEKLKNYDKRSFNNDVFFAMSHGVHRGVLKQGKFDKREIFIDKLMKKIPNIRFDLYGMKSNQPVWADNYINAISQSKIGLNLSQGKAVKYYSSDRFAQLIGNGLLVMIDEQTKFRNFFSDKELIFYKNINDLSYKISKYSTDDKERRKIAKKGREKYFKYFNSSIVADFIINKTFDINKDKNYLWHNE
jgi:glycosyltransferase involved in cell wall biosynthesis